MSAAPPNRPSPAAELRPSAQLAAARSPSGGIDGQILRLVALCVLPFAALGAADTWLQWQTAQESASERASNAARVASDRIEDHLVILRTVRDAVATIASFDPDQSATNAAFLGELKEKLAPIFGNLGVWTLDGTSLGSALTPPEGWESLPRRNPMLFERARRTGALALGPPHVCPATGDLTLTAAVPLFDPSGSVAAMATVSTKLSYFGHLLDVATLPPGSAIELHDWRGVVVSCLEPAAQGAESRPAKSTVRIAEGAESEARPPSSVVPEAMIWARVNLLGLDPVWSVVVGIPHHEALAGAKRALLRNSALAAGALLLALAAGRLAARRVSRPLTRLASDVERWGAGDLAHRTTVHAPGEPGLLAAGFNRMAEDLEQRANSLRDSEERYRLLLDGLHDIALFQLDDGGHVELWNAAAQRLFGFAPKEILGQPLARFRAPEDVAAGAPRTLLEEARTRGRAEGEGWRVRKDGSRFLASEVLTRLPGASGAPGGFAIVVRDVTQRRGLEDQLSQAQKMEALGKLAGGVAHDFNNLLTAIQGFADLAQVGLAKRDVRWGHVEEIRKAADRAASLTRKLLSFGRRQTMQARTILLNDLVRNTEGLLRRSLGEPIELVVKLCKTPLSVHVDPSKLEQVLLNLAINARDAMPSGGTLTIRTEETEAPRRGAEGAATVRIALLTVSDTGVGMDAQTVARAFEPLFTTKGRESGTGLGLSVAYAIVQQSGGWIDVVSKPGAGSTFLVAIPLADRPLAPPEPPPGPATKPPEGATVLVVEDESAVRRLASLVLTSEGYHVLTAQNGDEALAVARSHDGPIHLLVTDAVLPGIGGSSLAEALTKERPELRVLFVSGYAPDSVSVRGVIDQGAAYLQKPFSPELLKRRVRDLIDGPGRWRGPSAN